MNVIGLGWVCGWGCKRPRNSVRTKGGYGGPGLGVKGFGRVWTV